MVVASNGGADHPPAWYVNLRAHPDITIRDKTELFEMRAREVDDPDERARLWAAANEAYPPYDEYQAKTDRVIPVFLAEPR